MTDDLIRRGRESGGTGLDLSPGCVTCKELTDALEALQSRLDAAEPDAKRYQWLRDNEDGLTVVDIIFMDSNEDGPTDVWYSRYGHDLDVAIDAVIAQEQKP